MAAHFLVLLIWLARLSQRAGEPGIQETAVFTAQPRPRAEILPSANTHGNKNQRVGLHSQSLPEQVLDAALGTNGFPSRIPMVLQCWELFAPRAKDYRDLGNRVRQV